MKAFKSILPHATIVLAGIFATFLVLDTFNPTMDWVGNPISTVLLGVFCAVAAMTGVTLAYANHRESAQGDAARPLRMQAQGAYRQPAQAQAAYGYGQQPGQQQTEPTYEQSMQGRHSASPASPYQDEYRRTMR